MAETQLVTPRPVARTQLSWLAQLTLELMEPVTNCPMDPLRNYHPDIMSLVDNIDVQLPEPGCPLKFRNYLNIVEMLVMHAHITILNDDNIVWGCRLRASVEDPMAGSDVEQNVRRRRIILLFAVTTAHKLARCRHVPWFAPAIIVQSTAGWHALHSLGILGVFVISTGIGYLFCGGVDYMLPK